MENFKQKCVRDYAQGCSSITDVEFDQTFGDDCELMGGGGKLKKLPFWMGSLDKIRTQRTLNNWLGAQTKRPLVVSAKIDGVSGLFHEGKMYTRGNGEYGQDISKVLKYLDLPTVKYTVRGEIVMKEKTFKDKYSSTAKNARNMVAGLLNRKEDDGVELNDISFYAYEIVGKKIRPSKQYLTLERDGFTVPVHLVIDDGDCDFDKLYNSIFDKRLETETDGVVVTIDLPYSQPTKGNPKFAMALKKDLEEDTRIVTVKEVEWNISKWRVYKPVVVIEPVDLKGVTISRTSGFNAKYIFENKINTGSILRIKRSGGVIPTITDILQQSDCPSTPASSPLVPIWSGVDLVAPEDTQEEGVKKLMGAVSCLGIKHLSRATSEKLYTAGFTSLFKVIFAGRDGFISAGVGNKMSEKISAAIETLFFETGVDVVKLLAANCSLGYGIGEKMIQLLFESFPDFMTKSSVSSKELVAVPGFGGKRAILVEKNYKASLDYIRMLEKEGVKLVFPVKAVSNPLTRDSHKGTEVTLDSHSVKEGGIGPNQGLLKYVFTGFRDVCLEAKLDIYSAVSSKTDYLVVKSLDLQTTKVAKAKKLGVKIITLDQLLHNLSK